jgi:hypothetical protein
MTELMVNADPDATSIPPPPDTSIESVPPLSVTVPSSTRTPAASWVPLTVTVNVPVASLPAEKTAVSPGVHGAVAKEPVESADQFGVEASQVPAGVVPPAPGVEPSMSQKLSAARRVEVANAMQNDMATRGHAIFFIRSHEFFFETGFGALFARMPPSVKPFLKKFFPPGGQLVTAGGGR